MIKDKDPEVNELWVKCKEHGIEPNLTKRWEEGIEHHQKAKSVFLAIMKSDWAFGEDYFCWKKGGDGDNGEHLMSSLSVYFELVDAGVIPKPEGL